MSSLWDILFAMPWATTEDRLQAGGDALLYGGAFAKREGDVMRRIDPRDVALGTEPDCEYWHLPLTGEAP